MPVYDPENPQQLLPEDQWRDPNVTCEEPPGPNAMNGETPVHVHRGLDEDGNVYRWEDVENTE